MITKTTEHETDRAGKRLLRDALEPLGWVVNDVQEDYGIDSSVQVFDGQTPTGTWFHVQLKSSLNPDYSSDGSFISHSLRIDHARHFALELRHPTFLILADVAAKRIFWACPQLDRRLLVQLRTAPANESITVRVPTTQELPKAVPSLLSDLGRAFVVLSSRELAASPTARFAESLVYSEDPDKLNAEFQNKANALKLHKIAALYTGGEEVAALERAEALIRDPDATLEAKFWASIQACNIKYSILATSGRPQEELSRYRAEHAISLQKLTRSSEQKAFKFYALIARRAAELEVLTHENFRLSMLQQAHLQKGGNPFLLWRIYARRAWLAKAITTKYGQCVRLSRYAAASQDPWLLGRALTNVTNALGTYVATLRLEGETETESAFSQSALQISRLAAWIAKETGDDNGIAMVVLSSILVVHTETSETYTWATETAEGIVDPQIRESALEGLVELPVDGRERRLKEITTAIPSGRPFRTWLRRKALISRTRTLP